MFSVGRAIGGLFGHGDDLDLAGGLDRALGVCGLARVTSSVLWEDLLNGDGSDAVLVLHLQDLVGAKGLPVFGPRYLNERKKLILAERA